MDVICPILFLDHKDLFEKNVQSWLRELPVNRIIIGIGSLEVVEYLNDFVQNTEKCIEIYQLDHNCQGTSIKGLMDIVETRWFAYLHADAFITPYAYDIMKRYMNPRAGIIESARFHWDGSISQVHGYFIPFYDGNCNYYNFDRAFSGFQIFQKKAVQSLLDRMEDDYVQRNEDLIFQYECLINGYNYWKTMGIHIHQNIKTRWRFSLEKSNIIQVKGLIKYTEPLHRITLEPCLNALSDLKNKGLINIYKIIKFCNKLNKKYWKRLILKKWDEL